MDKLTLLAEVSILNDRIKQLEEELKDINDSWKIVINEECAKDEVHCTCVPVLRAELLELEKKKVLNYLNHLKYADAYFSKDTYKQLEAENQRLIGDMKEILEYAKYSPDETDFECILQNIEEIAQKAIEDNSIKGSQSNTLRKQECDEWGATGYAKKEE